MRKEASLDQWKVLYEVGMKIKEIQPWNDLWDTELIMISLPEWKDPCYCSVLGHNGNCFGVNTFVGNAGLRDFMSIVSCPDDLSMTSYIMYEQSNLSCNFDDRDFVLPEQMKVIKDLGLRFRGHNQWLNFLSYRKGFTPYILDQQEVVLLTGYLSHFVLAFQAFKDRKIKVDFDSQQVLKHSFDKKKGEWVDKPAPLPAVQIAYDIMTIEDKLLERRLMNMPVKDLVLEMDMPYIGITLTDKKYERPVNPKLLLLVDHATEMILGQDFITPDVDEIKLIFDKLVYFISKTGRPKKILVRNPSIYYLIKEFCDSMKIRLEMTLKLPSTDSCMEELSRMGM
ncbi:MAG: DUF7309 domain-containing protein [Saccharofermentanales bacterium]